MIKTPILTRVYGLALVEISRDGIWAGTGGGLVFYLLKVFRRIVMLLLVKCYDIKAVYVTLQLGHLSVDSASGG